MKDSLKVSGSRMEQSKEEVGKKPSFLKLLREKKNLSLSELARRVKASRKKLQAAESKGANKIELGELDLFARALGYKMSEVMPLVRASFQDNLGIKKILLDAPAAELNIGEGAKLVVFENEDYGNFIGMLHLEPGKSVKRESLPLRDAVFGIVFDGTLFMDCLGIHQHVIKCSQAFCFSRPFPVEFCNTDHFRKVSVLFSSVYLPRF